jgi:DNA-binding NarL/FixJ family response regulator
MQETVAEAAATAPVVMVVDSMILRRAGLVGLMREWAEANRVSVAAIPPDLVAEAATEARHCALAVLNLGGMSLADPVALGWLRTLVDSLPRTPLAVVSDCDSPAEVVTAFRAGARGFIPTSTDPDVTLQAFAFIMGGGSYFPPGALLSPRGAGLSPRGATHAAARKGEISATASPSALTQRQQAVLSRLQEGQSNKAIARALGMKEPTVKVHVRQIMKKLGAANRTQAALASVTLPAPRSATAAAPSAPAAGDASGAENLGPARETPDRAAPTTH